MDIILLVVGTTFMGVVLSILRDVNKQDKQKWSDAEDALFAQVFEDKPKRNDPLQFQHLKQKPISVYQKVYQDVFDWDYYDNADIANRKVRMLYRRALYEIHPSNFIDSQNLEFARELLLKACELTENDHDHLSAFMTHMLLGEIYTMLGEYELAFSTIDHALSRERLLSPLVLPNNINHV